jgi:putative colanic acid biosysnthesis UDP-glucose lipid carrier transferase
MGHRGETRAPGAMQARVDHDLAYLRHWSPGLDLLIVWRTLSVLRGDAKAV